MSLSGMVAIPRLLSEENPDDMAECHESIKNSHFSSNVSRFQPTNEPTVFQTVVVENLSPFFT